MDAVDKLKENGIAVDLDSLAAIANSYSIVEIAVFGSSIRRDMDADSDVDLLVTFSEGASISLFDLMDVEDRLSELFGRSVDIVEPGSLSNPIRRRAILSSKETLYVEDEAAFFVTG